MTKAMLEKVSGSAIYDLPGLEDFYELTIPSPLGNKLDVLRAARIGPTEIVFLPRHGSVHRLSPSDINNRANIDAKKRAGVTDIVSLTACG
jgi:5'-methylthioadenosine phosphorylase